MILCGESDFGVQNPWNRILNICTERWVKLFFGIYLPIREYKSSIGSGGLALSVCIFVWRGSFLCAAFIVCRDSLICVIWLIHMWDVTCSYVSCCHRSAQVSYTARIRICVTLLILVRLILICAETHSYVCRGAFIRDTHTHTHTHTHAIFCRRG